MTFTNEVPPTLFLQLDLDWLDHQIEHVRAMIRQVKLQGQESTEQSSESWHDNYNFEESQRQLKMLMNHLGGLSKARERAIVVEPLEFPTVVDVGTTVTFVDLQSGSSDTFSIGSYMVSDDLRELDFISYETPVAEVLRGLAVGESRVGKVGGHDREFRVTAIDSATPSLEIAREARDRSNAVAVAMDNQAQGGSDEE